MVSAATAKTDGRGVITSRTILSAEFNRRAHQVAIALLEDPFLFAGFNQCIDGISIIFLAFNLWRLRQRDDGEQKFERQLRRQNGEEADPQQPAPLQHPCAARPREEGVGQQCG